MIYHAVVGAAGVVSQVGAILSTDGTVQDLLTAMGAVEITQAEYNLIKSAHYGATLINGVVTAFAPPTPTLAQQAAALLAGGLTVTSTGTPAINGTYGCADADQARFNRMFSAIQKAGGNAWPAGIASLVWPLKGAAPVTFTSVATFLEVALAVEAFVIACDQIMVTDTGTLPASAVTIA